VPARRLAELTLPGEDPTLLQYFSMCGLWALTTYDACDLRCSYCVSYAQGPSVPRYPPGTVGPRIRAELESIPPEAAICVGGLIDTYPHAEVEHRVTREALVELLATDHHLVIVTKGATILRDLDLLSGHPRVSVNLSLPTIDEGALRQIEPHVAGAAERLAVIDALVGANVPVQLHAQPWIPGMSDALAIVEHADGRYPVCFGPLNVQSPTLARTALARRFDQAAINEAYLREEARVGPREGVTWQRPVWLGEDGSEATARPDSGPSLAATIRWMVDTLANRSYAMTVLEVLSPFVRCHDRSGLTGRPGHPGSGAYRDVLHEAMGALDDVRFTITALSEDLAGRTVDVDILVEGRSARPLLGHQPTGDDTRFVVSNRYRFDTNDLIVEYWQDTSLTLPMASV